MAQVTITAEQVTFEGVVDHDFCDAASFACGRLAVGVIIEDGEVAAFRCAFHARRGMLPVVYA